MGYTAISFYLYRRIPAPTGLMDELKQECLKLNLLGRILIAEEGINGAVSGRELPVKLFKRKLLRTLGDLSFREQSCSGNAYHKLVVKVRKEICAFGQPVDLSNRGRHLQPSELKTMYAGKKEFYLIDARNDYEFAVGHFRSALNLPTRKFSDFSRAASALEPLKNKKIVLYCTGGIRCEKASAYLKERGFADVNQLSGGIINYVTCLKDHREWQGGLFVFDDRLVSDVGEAITACQSCGNKSQQYTNCHNLSCDKLFIACQSCLVAGNYSCSSRCSSSGRRRARLKPTLEIVGVVKNYYPRVNAALVVANRIISVGQKIAFNGKTTNFFQQISEIRDDAGRAIGQCSENQLITIPVAGKVRKNDRVIVA